MGYDGIESHRSPRSVAEPRLEDYLIEGVTLGWEQQLDKRTIRKRIKQAIESLREAEKDLP